MKQLFKRSTITNQGAFRTGSIIVALLLLAGIVSTSCEKEFEFVVSLGEPISLSASDTTLELSAKYFTSNALNLNWTRGSNQGTGSPISYTLQMDLSENNFASPIIYELGKAVYEKSFKVGDLNGILIETLGVDAGSVVTLEARVIADIYDESVEDDVSETIRIEVGTYIPVPEALYILGTATSVGDDILSAIEMTPTTGKPWEFVYEGQLGMGRVFFSETRDACWCKTFYTKNTSDDERMIRNEEGLGNDKRWLITSDNYYKVVVDLVDLKIQIDTAVPLPFSELFIVGDASPGGNDISNPEAFTQSLEDPNIFTYEGYLIPGEFKISTFTGDWCDGQWLNPGLANQDITGTDFIITQGCDGPDNKWLITEETEGRYTITVNLAASSISINKVQLYLIGDGGPNGWNIEDPEPMVYADGVYTFTGPLGADNPTGEFKFSKFTGNWCEGGWILGTTLNQSISNTSMSYYTGCPPDEMDYKWKLAEGEAGDYVIIIDLENDAMTITKQ